MKYRKKPVIIEAIQYLGYNANEINRFVHGEKANDIDLTPLGKESHLPYEIHTLEGRMKASVGDYVIKGVKGEFYPCKPDIFNETYEVINE